MSDTKHTPAPWSAAYIYAALRHIERNVDRDAYLGEEDAKEIDEGRLNVPSARYNPADVALIVAAPDLLAACEAVRATFEALAPDLTRLPREVLNRLAALLVITETALSKAKGGA